MIFYVCLFNYTPKTLICVRLAIEFLFFDELKQLSSKKKNANENIEGLGDIDVSKLNKLSKSQIKKLGGESFTQELKTNVGKSKTDLFVDKTTGDIFSIGKKGTPPQFVGNIDVTFFD